MTILLHIFGIVALVAGLLAFVAPLSFFELLAEYTGQPNSHLIRDVGAAYVSGATLRSGV